MTGVRLEDLRVEDSFVAARIIGKGNKERVLKLPPELIDRCRETFAGSQWLLETAGGKPYRREYVSNQIKRAGERVLVIAELMDTEDASQLWSGRYHRELTDFLKLQEDLAEAIVYQFGGEYLRAEWRRVNRLPTGNVDAWSLIQKAKSANLPVNRNALDEALRLTRQALELDPGYAGALANLASILM